MKEGAGLLERCTAELLGTFFLVFIGCGACVAHHGDPADVTHVGVALAFGGVVMCVVYAIGHLSGAHINPAVTIAFAASGHFSVRETGPYVAAQCAGATLASAAHLASHTVSNLMSETLRCLSGCCISHETVEKRGRSAANPYQERLFRIAEHEIRYGLWPASATV